MLRTPQVYFVRTTESALKVPSYSKIKYIYQPLNFKDQAQNLSRKHYFLQKKYSELQVSRHRLQSYIRCKIRHQHPLATLLLDV